MPHTEIKSRDRRKSRFGCRNCKLRKVKCDETRPGCSNCCRYGVLCNFDFTVSDLQPVSEERTKQEPAKQFRLPSVQKTIGHAIWADDGSTFYMLDAQDRRLFDRFRYRTVYSLGGEAMVDIYENHMLAKCFTVSQPANRGHKKQKEVQVVNNDVIDMSPQHPFLMHGTLAVAAVHDRYLGIAPTRRRSVKESYHTSKCTALFNKWLSLPIEEERKDPIWSTAGTLSILTFSSTNACEPEEAWPLGMPDSSDLEWMRLGNGKMTLWQMVNPLRPESVFRRMFESLGHPHQPLPIKGNEGVLPELAQLCQIGDSSTAVNNPYFTVAHSLSRLLTLPESDITLGKILMVSSHMHNGFEEQLHNKDPLALLLLYIWYNRARDCKWWIEFRAKNEIPAIRLYLRRYHKSNAAIQALLQRDIVASVSRPIASHN